MDDELQNRKRAWLTGATPTNAVPTAITSQSAGAHVANIINDISGAARAVVRQEEAYRKANTEPGVIFDEESGADAWTRIMLSFRRSQDNQKKYLQEKYGKDAVRETSDGRLMFRVVNAETKVPRDIIVDEDKMTGRDFLDLAGSAPEIAASLYFGRGQSPANAKLFQRALMSLRNVGASSLGGEAVGTTKDAAMDLFDFGSIDAGEIGKERAKALGADAVIGTAMAPLGALFRWSRAPLAGSRRQLHFDAETAQGHFETKTGIHVPMSVGELTGSPAFQRVEATAEKRIGSAGPVKELREEQQAALKKLQDKMIGKTLPDDEVGQSAIDAIRASAKPGDEAAEAAASRLAAAQEKGIQRALAAKTQARPELYPNEVGKAVRGRIIQLRDLAKGKSEELYAEVAKAPGGTGQVFSTTTLSADAARILQKVPSRGNVPMKDWVPDDVVNRLNSLTALKGAKLSLSDLQQMRRDAYDAMPRMEGAPGRGAHYLGEIADIITKAIDDGVNAMPGGQLKTALTRANKFYKEKVVPFNRVGLTELFRGADEAGHIGDSAVAMRIAKNPDQFRMVKEALGTGSHEFTRLKRFIVDDLLQNSADELKGGTIDADKFFKNVVQFKNSKDTREIAEEVLGKDVSDVLIRARQLSFAHSGKMDKDELAKLLKGGKVSTYDLQKLVDAQKVVDEQYRNKIVKAIAAGDIGEETIRPSEFVSRIVDSKKIEPAEVREMLAKIEKVSPDTAQQIRAKTMQHLIGRASRPVNPSEFAQVVGGDPSTVADPVLLSGLLRDPSLYQKAKDILGKELFEDLAQYVKLTGPLAKREAEFSSAGGISAGFQVAELMKNPFRYMSQWGKDRVAALMLLSPWLRQYAASTGPWKGGPIKTTWDTAATLGSLAASSPPFLRELLVDSGEEEANRMVESMKSSLDQFVAEESAKQAPTNNASERRTRFLQGK